MVSEEGGSVEGAEGAEAQHPGTGRAKDGVQEVHIDRGTQYKPRGRCAWLCFWRRGMEVVPSPASAVSPATPRRPGPESKDHAVGLVAIDACVAAVHLVTMGAVSMRHAWYR